MRFQIEADPGELEEKAFELFTRLTNELAKHDRRIAAVASLVKAVAASAADGSSFGGSQSSEHRRFEYVLQPLPDPGTLSESGIGVRAYFDPESLARANVRTTADTPAYDAQPPIGPDVVNPPTSVTMPGVTTTGLDVTSPYVASTVAATTGRAEDALGPPTSMTNSTTADQVGPMERDMSVDQTLVVRADDVEEDDAPDAKARKEAAPPDASWTNTPFAQTMKRGLGLCTLRVLDGPDGRMYEAELPSGERMLCKSISSAADWVWVRKNGFATVADWRAANPDARNVPSGGGRKFWNLAGEES